MALKPKVLVMVDWYAPGFKAGGPIRSAVNFADQLENELDIYVFTTDRDLGSPQPYPGIEADCWVSRGNHHVFYATPAFLRWTNISRVIRDLAPGHIYLNSMFSRFHTIYPLLMKRMGKIKGAITLAPRGMLRSSALAHKPGKKKIFLGLFKFLGLAHGVRFHVTDQTEKDDVGRIFGRSASLFEAGNLPGKQSPYLSPPLKEAGMLNMVFVGRIHPIKNLDLLLRALQGQDGRVKLTVIATPEDEVYWEQCRQIIQSLGEDIRVELLMNLPHDQVESRILASHIFVLPTRGENFGHAIFEALSAGRPVIISDQTPWRQLEPVRAGWDLPIDHEGPFRDAIGKALGWNQETLETWCRGAWQRAQDYLSNNELKQSYLKQFN